MASTTEQLFHSLNKLDTEQRNIKTAEIDLANSFEIVELINREDQKVAIEIDKKLPEIATAVDLVSESFSVGGRLLYFGAGTSGRLGVLDAAECPPTFGTHPEQVRGFIAGGKQAMFRAQEGAEDSEEVGIADLDKSKATSLDVVCGLAASGRTPYVLGVLKEAAKRRIKTIFVTTVPESQLNVEANIIIDVPVGPEVIMGSTRMKSGSAQKMILNMITTGAMIRQGKVYENVMVDLQLTNEKLVERAKRIISTFGDVSYERATELLKLSDGHVKTAIVMAINKLDKKEAVELLRVNDGFIRRALRGY
ncbi:MAG: N-acetylmuramic acid 6-phosphate etherase [Balneolaceae bacterium]